MREAEQEVIRGMVNDTWPGTAEDDMSEAMSRIDTSDPTVGARIMATAFAQRSNTYYYRGMGDAGKGILKTTPGFQRKGAAGASSSNSRLQDQFESLQSELEAQRARESELEAQRAREMAAMAESYAASTAAHMERVNEVTNANQAAMRQWMTACMSALAAGQPFPPMPTPIPLPQWPHPQWPQPQQQPPQPDQPPPQDPPNGNDELDFEFLHRQMD